MEQRGGAYGRGGGSGSTRGDAMQRMFRRATSQRESPVVEDYNFAATDEMGIRMGRPPFLHYVSLGMADNIGVDGPNLATL